MSTTPVLSPAMALAEAKQAKQPVHEPEMSQALAGVVQALLRATPGGMPAMKLHTLAVIVQGRFLSTHKEPAFPDVIVPGPNGPELPVLSRLLRHHRYVVHASGGPLPQPSQPADPRVLDIAKAVATAFAATDHTLLIARTQGVPLWKSARGDALGTTRQVLDPMPVEALTVFAFTS